MKTLTDKCNVCNNVGTKSVIFLFYTIQCLRYTLEEEESISGMKF